MLIYCIWVLIGICGIALVLVWCMDRHAVERVCGGRLGPTVLLVSLTYGLWLLQSAEQRRVRQDEQEEESRSIDLRPGEERVMETKTGDEDPPVYISPSERIKLTHVSTLFVKGTPSRSRRFSGTTGYYIHKFSIKMQPGTGPGVYRVTVGQREYQVTVGQTPKSP